MLDSEIHTFQGSSMRDALARVRETLGPNAVILHTRQIQNRTILGKRKDTVEVTASPPIADSAAISTDWQDSPSAPRDLSPAMPRVFRPGTSPKSPPSMEPAATSRSQSIVRPKALETTPTTAPFDPSRLERHLRLADLSDELVRSCLLLAEQEFPRDIDPDDPRLTDTLVDHLASKIPNHTNTGLGDRTGVVALVGPTGVGKTSCIAKIALWASDHDDRKVRLIAADPRRVGAEAELRRYAQLLHLPCDVARNAAELQAHVRSATKRELLLVDTPGVNPCDPDAVARLLSSIPAAIDVWLVLSANTRDASIQAALDVFQHFGYLRLILTKLDETPSAGAVAAIAARASAPVRFLSMGQDVVGDLVSADAQKLAQWALGKPWPIDANQHAMTHNFHHNASDRIRGQRDVREERQIVEIPLDLREIR